MDIGARKKTREIDLVRIQHVPVAMFVGKYDTLADKKDAEWTRDQIGDQVIHYQEIDGGHMTFIVAEDMSWWTETAMDLIREYQPLWWETKVDI